MLRRAKGLLPTRRVGYAMIAWCGERTCSGLITSLTTPIPMAIARVSRRSARRWVARRSRSRSSSFRPGQAVCPYHYEYEEEWLVVLSGPVTVRTPEGEEELESGEIVCFAPGPAGAHKVRNSGEATARVLMFSSAREPAVAVYPDSDKIGVWPGNSQDNVILRRADGNVGYWDGEH